MIRTRSNPIEHEADDVFRSLALPRSLAMMNDCRKTCYFICATPRSGSWLLANGIRATGIAGAPEEYFDERNYSYWRAELDITDSSEFYQKIRIAGTTSNGVFGAKSAVLSIR